jgi:pyrroline-5-carboxylate reductase
MFELGLIGYGSMGSMLLNGFLTTGALSGDQVIVSTRTRSKLNDIKNRLPDVTIADSNIAVAQQSKIVLLAVKPRDVKPVLDEIIGSLPRDTHLVFISAGVMIKDVERIFKGKISKVIPSMTMEVREGTALTCHNDRVDEADAEKIEKIFGSISTVKRLEESNFEVAGDLTSCAPGLLATVAQEFMKAGLRHGSLTKEEAEQMVIASFYGTAKLIAEKGMDFDEVISRVATPGGITEEGVKVLRAGLPATFDRVFDKTMGKQEIVKKGITEQFEGKVKK